jgi:hypothetical protein
LCAKLDGTRSRGAGTVFGETRCTVQHTGRPAGELQHAAGLQALDCEPRCTIDDLDGEAGARLCPVRHTRCSD